MALYIGLMSGTSADGIDAALVELTDRPRLLHSHSEPYPEALRRDLLDLADNQTPIPLSELGRLDHRVGTCFAEAVQRLLQEAGVAAAEVTAIGSHGQTVAHFPDGEHPFSLQIGDPSVIAERTGILTVADFRRADLAAGGQGAPLAPAFHAAVLRDPQHPRAVVNIGGMANVTLLPGGTGEAVGFDTGPGNALMDAWIQSRRGGRFDREGRWAASGTVHPGLLAALLEDDYFHRPPPKSTGREYFNLGWLQPHLEGREVADEDVQATLAQLTVESIARAVRMHLPAASRLIVCGGGVHNAHLLERLTQALAPVPVVSSAEYGVDPDWVEAMAFAWLAARRLEGQPGNLPSVTGARHPALLGAVYGVASS